jgi:aminoglycoside 6'-N-acetyltransferase
MSSVNEHDDSSSLGMPGKVFTVTLRELTIEDVPLLEKWDEQEYIQAASGDADYEDWNWYYELSRTPPPTWRHQLLASLQVHDKPDDDEDESNEDEKEPTRSIPIGVVQVLDPLEEEFRYWWTRDESRNIDNAIPCEANLRAIDIWIGDPKYIGQGYGSIMMDQALQKYCFCFDKEEEENGVTAVLVDPLADNEKAIRFYQKCGFRPVEYRYFGLDRCLVHRLERRDYLEKLKKACT